MGAITFAQVTYPFAREMDSVRCHLATCPSGAMTAFTSRPAARRGSAQILDGGIDARSCGLHSAAQLNRMDWATSRTRADG